MLLAVDSQRCCASLQILICKRLDYSNFMIVAQMALHDWLHFHMNKRTGLCYFGIASATL